MLLGCMLQVEGSLNDLRVCAACGGECVGCCDALRFKHVTEGGCVCDVYRVCEGGGRLRKGTARTLAPGVCRVEACADSLGSVVSGRRRTNSHKHIKIQVCHQ